MEIKQRLKIRIYNLYNEKTSSRLIKNTNYLDKRRFGWFDEEKGMWTGNYSRKGTYGKKRKGKIDRGVDLKKKED